MHSNAKHWNEKVKEYKLFLVPMLRMGMHTHLAGCH